MTSVLRSKRAELILERRVVTPAAHGIIKDLRRQAAMAVVPELQGIAYLQLVMSRILLPPPDQEHVLAVVPPHIQVPARLVTAPPESIACGRVLAECAGELAQ
jgi:hypothetical protein